MDIYGPVCQRTVRVILGASQRAHTVARLIYFDLLWRIEWLARVNEQLTGQLIYIPIGTCWSKALVTLDFY